MCCIQIGENDIGRFDCSRLFLDILSSAAYMHEGLGLYCVIIGQLLRRHPWALSRASSSRKGVTINQLEKDGCSSLDGVHFWRHRGFWADFNFLCRDGVHLRCPRPSVHVVSSSPMHRYWRSVRSAILHYKRLFRPV